MVGCTSWLALVLMLLAIPVSDTFAFLESIPLDITHGVFRPEPCTSLPSPPTLAVHACFCLLPSPRTVCTVCSG
jgi:hypothetical protein